MLIQAYRCSELERAPTILRHEVAELTFGKEQVNTSSLTERVQLSGPTTLVPFLLLQNR